MAFSGKRLCPQAQFWAKNPQSLLSQQWQILVGLRCLYVALSFYSFSNIHWASMRSTFLLWSKENSYQTNRFVSFRFLHIFYLLVSALFTVSKYVHSDPVSRRHPPADVTLQTESGMICVLFPVLCEVCYSGTKAGRKEILFHKQRQSNTRRAAFYFCCCSVECSLLAVRCFVSDWVPV